MVQVWHEPNYATKKKIAMTIACSHVFMKTAHWKENLLCHFFALTTFWRHQWSITGQMHSNMESICCGCPWEVGSALKKLESLLSNLPPCMSKMAHISFLATLDKRWAHYHAERRQSIFDAKLEAWRHKLFHIFFIFYNLVGFIEIVNPFSCILNTISSEKSWLISAPFLTC